MIEIKKFNRAKNADKYQTEWSKNRDKINIDLLDKDSMLFIKSC